jgi:hypothetical protein
MEENMRILIRFLLLKELYEFLKTANANIILRFESKILL